MISISFFSGKGGVGKSTHSLMFASYLAYCKGKKVAVLDLDDPEHRINELRTSEELYLKNPDSPLSRYIDSRGLPRDNFYKIFCGSELGIYSDYLSEKDIEVGVDRVWDIVEKCLMENYDYFIIDFAGRYSRASLVFHVLTGECVDLVLVPVNTDRFSRKSAWIMMEQMHANDREAFMFWNNVSSDEINRPGFLDAGQEYFEKAGYHFLKSRIKSFSKARRDSDEKLFVRSTVCWPSRYVDMYCPELVSLYSEIQTLVEV